MGAQKVPEQRSILGKARDRRQKFQQRAAAHANLQSKPLVSIAGAIQSSETKLDDVDLER